MRYAAPSFTLGIGLGVLVTLAISPERLSEAVQQDSTSLQAFSVSESGVLLYSCVGTSSGLVYICQFDKNETRLVRAPETPPGAYKKWKSEIILQPEKPS